MNNYRNNILIITSSYPIKKGEIQGIFIQKQVNCLVKRGLKITILTPYVVGSKFFEIHENIKVYRFPYFFPLSLHYLSTTGGLYFGYKKPIIGKIQMLLYIISLIISTGIIIRKEHINLIHSHWVIPQGIAGTIWKIITGIPHITTAHVLDLTISDRIPFLKKIIFWILSYADGASVNSTYTHNKMLNLSPKNFPIAVIPMGMDESRISISKEKREYSKKEFTILFVGRLIEWKGVDTLILAASYLIENNMNIHLNIVGTGPEEKKLKDMVHSLHLKDRIIFKGRISDEKLCQEYNNASVFVLPSRPYREIIMEGLGVVLLEAMASGVPVIGSNVGGIPDIITDRVNGLLVPPGNPNALSAAIILIMQNPDMAKKFSLEGLKTVNDRFSWDKISNQFIELYNGILCGSCKLSQPERD
jgi:glycosyltransferase involved in cell wall biosynthesis